MTRSDRLALAAALYATVCTIATLYLPQPILPVLAREFGLGMHEASLAVTLTMLPLAFAPVAYGLLLETLPAPRLARWAVLALAAGHVGVCLAPSWQLILAARLAQGLAIPAALTAIMTLVSTRCPAHRVRTFMSWYISTTIVGGFLGRFCSGLMAECWGWRAIFGVLAVLLLAAFFLLRSLVRDSDGCGEAGFGRPSAAHVREVLAKPLFLRAYMMIFCCFFAFTATLNFLPFRLVELDGVVSPARAGVMYLGYLVGVATSLAAPRIVGVLGGERRAFLAGLLLFGGSVAACLLPDTALVFAALYPFCAGFFLIQTVGPGFVNSRADQHRGVVNGLYIAFYYAGGACGSFAPGLIYHAFGWNVFLAAVLCVVGLALLLASGLRCPGRQC
ncbi:MAG: MFS transporter [Desulfovibrionaceae bacterium]